VQRFSILISACLTIFCCTVSLPYAADFSGPVVSVIDGDTIDVLHNGQAERIRLNGIDSPEKGQAVHVYSRLRQGSHNPSTP
jgi:endonuclease YncB( thermonuclease family)